MATDNEKNKIHHAKEEEKLNVDWNDVKGKIRGRYSNVTDEDFQFVEGNETEVINRLQQKTGKTRAEVRDWVRSLSKVI